MGSHFHILWNGTALDWERHATQAAAEAEAKSLVRPGETYTIQEVQDNDCANCKPPTRISDRVNLSRKAS